MGCGCKSNSNKSVNNKKYANNDLLDINRFFDTFLKYQKEYYESHNTFGYFEFYPKNNNINDFDKYIIKDSVNDKLAYLNFYLDGFINIYAIIYIKDTKINMIKVIDKSYEMVNIDINYDIIDILKYTNNLEIVYVS